MIWKFESMQYQRDQADKTTSPMEVVGSPLKMSEFNLDDPSQHTPPPFLGQDTDQVLSEVLGLSIEEIGRLRQSNIVR